MKDEEMVEKVYKAIADEPEYPGEIPMELKIRISDAMESNDIDAIVFMLRSTVRLTKQGIKSRCEAAIKAVEGGER